MNYKVSAKPGRAMMGPGPAPGGKKVTVRKKKATTGVPRLNQLLKGGVDVPSTVALLGATHIGKEVLMYEFVAEGLRQNVPSIVILTKNNTTDFRTGLKKLLPNLRVFEEKGYVRYIDMYSLTVGLKGKNPYCNYIKGVERTDELLKVLSALEKIYHQKAPYHRVVVNDISMFHSKLGYAKTQDLVNSIMARSDSYNSVVILDIVAGVHPEGEVKALEDGLDGTIELLSKGTRFHLRVKGLGEPVTIDWVEYKFDEKGFDLFGSFALQRIH